MDNEPRWLDIETQLYPETTLIKRIIIQNEIDGLFEQIYSQVIYNSRLRQIDITDALVKVITKAYPFQVNFSVLYYDCQEEKFLQAGEYPFQQCFVLGEQFLEAELITIKLENMDQQKQQTSRRSKERTIKQVLQKVGQWRRIHIQNPKKISLQQAARMIGIPKRTLDDYYLQVRLAEKYNFDFQVNLNQGMGILRKYVRQHHQKKKQQPYIHILQKFKNKNK